MPGFGLSPFGLSAFGLGSPAAAPPPGALSAARARVLTLSGDYVLKDDGTYLTGDAVDQEVLWRLRTVITSFVGDPSVGNGVVRVKVWDDHAVSATQAEVQAALAPMVRRGVLRNVTVSAAPEFDAGSANDVYQVAYDKTGLLERP
jgi:hypothetical protein